MTEGNRERHQKKGIRAPAPTRLRSPFPWMSYPEAIVQLYLMEKGVPFIWHAFDGVAPDLTQLMPGYVPTFTLAEYRTALFVISPYFGTIPGVLDKVALADALLTVDGWKVVIIYESDILAGKTQDVVEQAVPALKTPAFRGVEKPNPYGSLALIAKRREIRSQNAHVQKLTKAGQNFKEDIRDVTPTRKRHVRRAGVGSGGAVGRTRSRRGRHPGSYRERSTTHSRG